jgi:hypothetical protein
VSLLAPFQFLVESVSLGDVVLNTDVIDERTGRIIHRCQVEFIPEHLAVFAIGPNDGATVFLLEIGSVSVRTAG